MGCGEINDLELASMDLYTRVKLRATNAKRCKERNGDQAYYNLESAKARFRESSRIDPRGLSTRELSAKAAANKENQCDDDALAVKFDGLIWLLEIAEGKLSSQCIEKSKEGIKVDEWINIEKCICWNLSAERAAIEMLEKMSEERSRTLGHNFTFGDLVWGKIKSHPWWPGKIYDESLATSSVCMNKEKGCVLVAFFGDNTYGWLKPEHTLPFERHFAEKSNQSHDHLFLKAVEEAILEVKEISALGLTCKCRNPSAFRPTRAKGLVKVDVVGYVAGSVYAVEQIEKARNGFKPHEMLSFLEELALRPISGKQKIISCLRNVARILACRNTLYEEFDETYYQAFEEQNVSNEITAYISHDTEMAHEAPYLHPKFSAKHAEAEVSEVGVKSSYQEKKVLQKRSLQEVSMPWFPVPFSYDQIVSNKKRYNADCRDEMIAKRP